MHKSNNYNAHILIDTFMTNISHNPRSASRNDFKLYIIRVISIPRRPQKCLFLRNLNNLRIIYDSEV